jgi:hypothetical protein
MVLNYKNTEWNPEVQQGGLEVFSLGLKDKLSGLIKQPNTQEHQLIKQPKAQEQDPHQLLQSIDSFSFLAAS